jgi:LacI family transcriptional regulator
LLSGPSRPTAILAQNDDMAVAAIAAAREMGLSVPQDLSVAGFDNSEVSRTAWPPLTTVNQPVAQMAWDAADRLIAMLDGKTVPELPQRRDHAHELLVRASTAAPAA